MNQFIGCYLGLFLHAATQETEVTNFEVSRHISDCADQPVAL